MAEIHSPIDCFNPDKLLKVWQQQNHQTIADAELQKLLRRIRRHCLVMLVAVDQRRAARHGLKVAEGFAKLRFLVESRTVAPEYLHLIVYTGILIVCSLAVFQTPVERWAVYGQYRGNENFNVIRQLALAG